MPGQQLTNVNEEEEEESSKVTFWLAIAIAATVLGSPAQFGYNMGVINAPEHIVKTIRTFYASVYKQSHGGDIPKATIDYSWAITVAVYAIGGMLGSGSAGYFANIFGRKKALMLNNMVAAIGGLMMGAAKYVSSFSLLMFLMVGGRIVVGINAGANTIIAPMYTAEIAPVKLRGLFGTLFQFGVVLALLLAQILGLPQVLGNSYGWNLLLALTIVPAVFQAIVLLVCPESPRYLLINKKNTDAARAALQKLRGTDDVEADIRQIQHEDELENEERYVNAKELLTSPFLREPLVIALTLQIAQQLSGINAVNFYSTAIFSSARLTDENARYATVGTGASQLLMIMPTIFLMDRVGRRGLMLIGLGGMCFFSGCVVLFTLLTRVEGPYLWFNLIAVFGIMGSFSVAPGPVPWLITAELFSQGPRPTAMSLAGATNWIFTFIVGLVFEPILAICGDYTFLIFMALDYIFWLFVFIRVPETKERHIDDIVETFRLRAVKRNPELSRLHRTPVELKQLDSRT